MPTINQLRALHAGLSSQLDALIPKIDAGTADVDEQRKFRQISANMGRVELRIKRATAALPVGQKVPVAGPGRDTPLRKLPLLPSGGIFSKIAGAAFQLVHGALTGRFVGFEPKPEETEAVGQQAPPSAQMQSAPAPKAKAPKPQPTPQATPSASSVMPVNPVFLNAATPLPSAQPVPQATPSAPSAPSVPPQATPPAPKPASAFAPSPPSAGPKGQFSEMQPEEDLSASEPPKATPQMPTVQELNKIMRGKKLTRWWKPRREDPKKSASFISPNEDTDKPRGGMKMMQGEKLPSQWGLGDANLPEKQFHEQAIKKNPMFGEGAMPASGDAKTWIPPSPTPSMEGKGAGGEDNIQKEILDTLKEILREQKNMKNAQRNQTVSTPPAASPLPDTLEVAKAAARRYAADAVRRRLG